MKDKLTLVIGNKAWSSWSLRPWLALKVARITFEEARVQLRQPDTAEQIARYSPSRRIPVLIHGGLTIWDSLAICEYAAELAPEAKLWPQDLSARALARSVSAEMHSGFHALRKEFPMDFQERIAGRAPSGEAEADIRRVVQIWREMRRDFGAAGPFLFGQFTIADAMYAPVTSRFQTYGIDLITFGDDGTAAAYAGTILAMPEMQEWAADVSRA